MNKTILLQLGDGDPPESFRFSMSTAAFDSLELSTSWEWPEQKRVGGSPALQYTGKETPTITLSGVVFPAHNQAFTDSKGNLSHAAAAGAGQIAAMRALADKAAPLGLSDSRGKNHGRWVIKSITETQSAHFNDGAPRRQNYTLTLARYD
jgi:phage protein U